MTMHKSLHFSKTQFPPLQREINKRSYSEGNKDQRLPVQTDPGSGPYTRPLSLPDSWTSCCAGE